MITRIIIIFLLCYIVVELLSIRDILLLHPAAQIMVPR